MVNYWEDWEEHPAECSCGWAGPLGSGFQNTDSMYVTEIECPQCSKKLVNIGNSGTDDQIKKIADAGGKRAKQYFVDLDNRKIVKTLLHDLALDKLGAFPIGTPPEIEGYETILEPDFFSHPALTGVSSWDEDYSSDDMVYAGYSIAVKTPVEEMAIGSLAFLYQDVTTGFWLEAEGQISTIERKRSATWYSENKLQTSNSRPRIPVAFLLKKSS